MKIPRKRIYLYVTHSTRPAKDTNGHLVEGKVESIETLNITDSQMKTFSENASVCIDLFEFKCLRNRFSHDGQDDMTTISHFLRKYKDKVNAACFNYLGMNKFTPEQLNVVTQLIHRVKEISESISTN